MPKTMMLVVALVVSIACLTAPAEAQVRKISANLVEVTVVGSGLSKEEAISAAKRKAVETGAGSYIYAQSKTANFELVKDTVLARSAGFVQKFTIIAGPKTTEDGAVELKAKVVVSIKGIQDTWGVVKNLLTEMGRPKVMVVINERTDQWAQQESTVQSGIENQLLKSGFLLVNSKQLKAIERKNMLAAVEADKPELIQAIAKQYGAQLFITGTAHATNGGIWNYAGVRFFRYGATCNVKCYRSDTGQLVHSEIEKSQQSDRATARRAAVRALDICSKRIAPKIQASILRFWLDVCDGRGEVQFTVEKIKAVDYFKLKKALKGVRGVKQVNGKFSSNVASLSIECDSTAEKLAEVIAVQFDGIIEITDISQNVIQGTYVKK